MDTKINNYLSTHSIIYKPNFWTHLQIGLKDLEILLEKLIRDGRIEKVYVPYFHNPENGEKVFLEDFFQQDKNISDQIKEKIESDYELVHIDDIQWSECYLTK